MLTMYYYVAFVVKLIRAGLGLLNCIHKRMNKLFIYIKYASKILKTQCLNTKIKKIHTWQGGTCSVPEEKDNILAVQGTQDRIPQTDLNFPLFKDFKLKFLALTSPGR